MRVGTDGAAEGKILWTLKKSNRPDYQDKLGKAGTEFVRGSYDAKSRELLIEGYRRDDPAGILGLDRYKQSFGKTNKTLGGPTWGHGEWDGRLDLTSMD